MSLPVSSASGAVAVSNPVPVPSSPALRYLATACATLGASLALAYFAKHALQPAPSCPDDAFVQKYSQTRFVRGKDYRVVFKEHKLGRELPMIVFVHGMGAQLQQWNEQLVHFSHMGNILALDIVGHGKSEKVPNKDAYTTESITKDILALLDIYKPKADSFILVGHSYGCTLVTHAYARLHPRPKALVLLCPKSLPSAHDREKLAKFSGAPTWLIDVLRVLDRRGGVNSPSVNRLLGRGAPLPLRKRQMAWNQAHATRIAQMMFEGANFAPADLYTAIDCPVLLIGGEEDTVCPVKADLEVVHAWLSASPTASVSEPFVIPNAGHQVMLEQPDLVNAIIYNWLIECGFDKLNLAAQLQTKNPSVSKWSLKNYAKWQKVQPVSLSPVRTSLFRPMKTMKQDDPSHTPAIFGRRHPEIGLIIDISAEAPPYVPADLPPPTTYLKLATTSKIPPTREEVKRFGDAAQAFWRKNPDAQVGVHCHYGFNRTGFVVCCYLIERCGVTVRDAIAAFEEARSPGIRHIHFKDELYMRYAAGSMRSPAKRPR